MSVGFDVISDLHLEPDDCFNWEGQPCSLNVIVAGNISTDTRTIRQTLLHLGRLYQTVIYLPGISEYGDIYTVKERNLELSKMCRSINNTILLHNHVVVVDGVAVFGVSGWYNAVTEWPDPLHDLLARGYRSVDLEYIKNTLVRLSFHDDIKKIVLVSTTPPGDQLYFGKVPTILENEVQLNSMLAYDASEKVTHWVWGGTDQSGDVKIGTVNYVNNAYFRRRPYWPKRIEISV